LKTHFRLTENLQNCHKLFPKCPFLPRVLTLHRAIVHSMLETRK
jgi:hypothetical protein